MNNLDISIYVPVFNGEKTIKSCLDSIFNQTLKPKKILVINDNSNDETNNILQSYEDKIEIINNFKNLGISQTRHLAVNHLKTKYIACIDADVEIEKDWLHNIYTTLKKNNATWVCGKMYEKYTENPCNFWRSLRLRQNWGENDVLNPQLIFGCNNLLKTDSIDLKEIYNNYGEYFKTNGDDNQLTFYLKKRNHTLFYDSSALCYHLLNDDYFSLASRYWRYIHFGDGLKKKNLIRTIKNIIRQFKKTIKWSFKDLLNFKFKLLAINFIVFYYFLIIDFKMYEKHKKK
tara:strand:+ start:174 stop:1037 length:864 start_codon:yes stop_codon:yes gene_type:complete